MSNYEIHRRPAIAGFDYIKVGTSTTSTFKDPFTGLVPGVEYYYRIKAVGDGSIGVWGGQANYAAATVAAVSGLQASATPGSVTVSWTAPEGDAASYRIYRRRAIRGESYSEIGTSETPSYSDAASNLTPGVEYYYRVRVVGSDGEVGGWGSGANYAGVHSLAAQGLQATRSASDVSLVWTAPAGDVDHYEMYRRVAISASAYTRIGTANTTSYTDPLSGLTPGAEYYYRVKPVSSSDVVGGWGAGSNYARIVTPSPSAITAVAGSDSVTVTWTAPLGSIFGYEIYRRVAAPGQSYTRIATTTTASYSDPLNDLTSGTSYLYRIKAIGNNNVVGNWGPGPNYAQITIQPQS